MRINIFTIPEEGIEIDFPFTEDTVHSLLPDSSLIDFSFHGAYVHGHMRKVGSNLFFKGRLEAVLDTLCSRCLEDVHLPISTDFSYTLLPEMRIIQEELELQAEDLEVSYYSGDVIDLDPMITEQLLLQIPMKVLCREDCRGLCPHCGINLNTGSCHCHHDHIDERLLILKKIKDL